VLQWRLPPAFVNEIMAGAMLQEGDEEVAKLDDALFERWLGDVDSGSAEAENAMRLEMEARLRRLALSYETVGDRDENASTRDATSAEDGFSNVERMAVFVATHYREDIQVREIGAAVDLHPDYANVLFREALGMTLSDYLLEHRTAHAQRMLATTDGTDPCEGVQTFSYARGEPSIISAETVFTTPFTDR
jgi:AraC-like DNA-binding protein